METQTKVSLSKGPGVMREQHSHILNNCGLCLLDHLVLVTIPAQDFTSASEKQYSTQVKKKTNQCWGFPGGPVVKNLPCNTRDAGSIPGLGTESPHAAEQLSPCATTIP